MLLVVLTLFYLSQRTSLKNTLGDGSFLYKDYFIISIIIIIIIIIIITIIIIIVEHTEVEIASRIWGSNLRALSKSQNWPAGP